MGAHSFAEKLRAARIAERLRDVRKARRVNQTMLANWTGVKQPAVVKWEKATAIPSPEHIELMAEVLGVPASWLGGERDMDIQLERLTRCTGPGAFLTMEEERTARREEEERAESKRQAVAARAEAAHGLAGVAPQKALQVLAERRRISRMEPADRAAYLMHQQLMKGLRARGR